MDSGKAKELLDKYDKDQSGLMELDEFVELSIALNRVNLNLVGAIDEKDMKAAELWSAFNKYDTNYSGTLDHKELRGPGDREADTGLRQGEGAAREVRQGPERPDGV